MKAKGVRLHAANDLRLEEFELPEITDDEILVKVVSDSIRQYLYVDLQMCDPRNYVMLRYLLL